MPPYIVKASEIKLTVIDCKNGMECAENHNITIGTFKIRRFFYEKKNYINGNVSGGRNICASATQQLFRWHRRNKYQSGAGKKFRVRSKRHFNTCKTF